MPKLFPLKLPIFNLVCGKNKIKEERERERAGMKAVWDFDEFFMWQFAR